MFLVHACVCCLCVHLWNSLCVCVRERGSGCVLAPSFLNVNPLVYLKESFFFGLARPTPASVIM